MFPHLLTTQEDPSPGDGFIESVQASHSTDPPFSGIISGANISGEGVRVLIDSVGPVIWIYGDVLKERSEMMVLCLLKGSLFIP